MTSREAIRETVNKLFIYTDRKDWNRLQSEVFNPKVYLDMSSLGSEPIDTTAVDICNQWAQSFKTIDSINHLAGNFIIEEHDGKAEVICYATATHYRANAALGKTREFVGEYVIKLEFTRQGWRIYAMKYILKYSTGNLDLI